ncbi:hypothetical protein B0T12DRAFT_421957 [Alternaria alternata]|nr:hypothetical protein B0T12DRAFT_421957 [Alternaria alternata]
MPPTKVPVIAPNVAPGATPRPVPAAIPWKAPERRYFAVFPNDSASIWAFVASSVSLCRSSGSLAAAAASFNSFAFFCAARAAFAAFPDSCRTSSSETAGFLDFESSWDFLSPSLFNFFGGMIVVVVFAVVAAAVRIV